MLYPKYSQGEKWDWTFKIGTKGAEIVIALFVAPGYPMNHPKKTREAWETQEGFLQSIKHELTRRIGWRVWERKKMLKSRRNELFHFFVKMILSSVSQFWLFSHLVAVPLHMESWYPWSICTKCLGSSHCTISILVIQKCCFGYQQSGYALLLQGLQKSQSNQLFLVWSGQVLSKC